MSALVRVARVEARLVPFDWAWAAEHASRIADNWARRRRATPAIFNGRVLLMTAGLEVSGDAVEARFFATDYAAMLAWIDHGCPDQTVANGFGMGALRGRDGAFVLGEMGPHTANAGRLYFPCGTPDMSDVTRDGGVDLGASLEREIVEETGLAADLLSIRPGWSIARDGGLVAFIRTIDLPVEAEEARALILRNLDVQATPELSDIVIVRSADDIDPARMPGVMPIFLRAALAGQG